MNEIVNNKVNLCDSCSQVYPDCTSRPENVYFGDGIGNDNICACSEYQPETHEERTETHACDLISRQAAVEALFELYEYQRDIDPTEAADLVRQGIYLAEKKIEPLPSAQPEIIRCKDCKHWNKSELLCEEWDYYISNEDFYCGCAERRQNGSNKD